jgi:hypothetical protein
VHVAKADCRQHAAGFPNLVLMLAQLRDSLTAEDSPVVSQENNEGGVPLPQRAETNFTAASFRQQNVRELCTHRSCHSPIIWDKWLVPLSERAFGWAMLLRLSAKGLIPLSLSYGFSIHRTHSSKLLKNGPPLCHLPLVPAQKLSRHQLAGETETAGRGLRRESTKR